MKALQLKDYDKFFKDEAAYKEFIRLFSANLEEDGISVVFADSEVVCTVMGPDSIREIMQNRIFRRFAEQPDLLDELRNRLEDDELVD